MTEFWLENPNILLNKSYITEIWPKDDFDLARKLNAITRIITIMGILGYYLTKSPFIPVSAVVSLIVLVIIFKSKNKIIKEGFSNEIDNNNSPNLKEILKKEFTMPTQKNPVMNILMNEYTDNPKRKPSAPIYNELVHKEMNQKAKSKTDKRLFKNLGDNISFENSMRNFYAMPNTEIPNNQKDFALFCYGNMPSCKDGDGLQCSKNNALLRTS
tara:strand:+ start:2391 stop:3032 length:642 start_codon:yes stop_codon:yes gene_type:complete